MKRVIQAAFMLLLLFAVPSSSVAEYAIFDVDRDCVVYPTRDGLAIVYTLLGQPASSLSGVINPRGSRTDPSAVRKYIKLLKKRLLLDMDGNGKVEPFTDGVMLYNALLRPGLSHSTHEILTDFDNGIRTLVEQVQRFVDSNIYQREIDLAGREGVGAIPQPHQCPQGSGGGAL